VTNGFAEDFSLEQLEDGTFARLVGAKWWGDRSPHGGYLASLMLKAMRDAIDDAARPARSLSVHFLAPPREGSVTIAPRIERSGRVLTSASATLRQGDAALALALATFSSSWPGLDYIERPMPDTPAPDALASAPMVDGLAPEFFNNFDVRPAIGERPFTSAGTAMSGGWIRTAEPHVLDEILMTVFADAWFPTIFARLSAPVPVPTVDLTVHFRTPLPIEGAAPDDFCLAVFSSEMAHDGFFVEDGEMWSASGHLLAQSRQLGVMIRPPPEGPLRT
jgi:acyl-CoA thioesterase